jgi:hypothetical protein
MSSENPLYISNFWPAKETEAEVFEKTQEAFWGIYYTIDSASVEHIALKQKAPSIAASWAGDIKAMVEWSQSTKTCMDNKSSSTVFNSTAMIQLITKGIQLIRNFTTNNAISLHKQTIDHFHVRMNRFINAMHKYMKVRKFIEMKNAFTKLEKEFGSASYTVLNTQSIPEKEQSKKRQIKLTKLKVTIDQLQDWMLKIKRAGGDGSMDKIELRDIKALVQNKVIPLEFVRFARQAKLTDDIKRNLILSLVKYLRTVDSFIDMLTVPYTTV